MRIRISVFIVALLALSSCSADPEPASPEATATSRVQTLDEANAVAIETGLMSAVPADVAAVLAPDVAEQYDADPVQLWPPGSAMTIDRANMIVYDSGVATVPATVTGPLPGEWILLMVEVGGQWRVLSTSEVS